MEKKGTRPEQFKVMVGIYLLCFTLVALACINISPWARNRIFFLSTHESESSAQNQSTNIPDSNKYSIVSKPDKEKKSESIIMKEEGEKPEEKVDNSTTLKPPQNKDVCNYAKGKWVVDTRKPFYRGCKYTQRNWVCRLTNRTDFSYENYRWQSTDCKMPEFEPSDFLKRMRNRVVAFIGDSLSREQFQSMMCMLTGGEETPDVEDVADQYGFLLVLRGGAVHHHGWAYRFKSTNTTILHAWSARLCDREPINATDTNTLFAMHLDRQPAFIRNHIDDLGVLVINTAHHWSKQMVNMDKEVIYLNGEPLKDKYLLKIENAKIFKVNNIVQWLDSKLGSNPNLQVFFRTTSPRHFLKGEWNTGGKCDSTIPLTRGSEVLKEESMDKVVADAVNGTRVKILDITALSDLRDEAHISHYGKKANDCLHWCLPGVPDTWNELLSALV
ncbi:hypothetical protein CCACVL1_25909 [Corchorus capsularis]|uniref:Uncharacterized protein n=1 Tax=Corchorus capsularis TaxID=210143 RepID=A0A1R3GGL0_COCAP|nr:hypothetical protein CCACVL1_25909 [Corchorus capsularis]